MQRFHYEQIDSTNEQALRLALEHPGKALFVTADMQTAGRGRFGRTWHSPRGGAWMSIVWPTPLAAQAYAAVPLVAALATLRTIRHALADAPQLQPADLKIKWPNDLLLTGKKVAGILCQRILPTDTPNASAESLVIGVGINVNLQLDRFPSDLRWPATTLSKASGLSIEVQPIVDSFAEYAAVILHQFEHAGLTKPMVAELSASLAFAGQMITLTIANQQIKGTVTGLDDQGRLQLATDAGTVAYESGEVKDVQTPS